MHRFISATLPANVLCTSEEASQIVITTTSHPDIVSTEQAAVQQHRIPDTPKDFTPLANLNRQQHDDESSFNTGKGRTCCLFKHTQNHRNLYSYNQ